MKRIHYFILIGLLAAIGCNQCGERPRLFSRVRDRFDGDDRKAASNNCIDGQPLAKAGTGYGNPTMGFPVGNSGPIYSGPTYPSYPTYPQGNPLPYPSGTGRSDELPPPGGYIPSPSVPAAPYAIPKSIESGRMVPKAGLTTGGK